MRQRLLTIDGLTLSPEAAVDGGGANIEGLQHRARTARRVDGPCRGSGHHCAGESTRHRADRRACQARRFIITILEREIRAPHDRDRQCLLGVRPRLLHEQPRGRLRRSPSDSRGNHGNPGRHGAVRGGRRPLARSRASRAPLVGAPRPRRGGRGDLLGSQSPLNPLFRVRFAVSQNALVREASAASSPGPRWIGLFHVKRVERLEGEVRFITGMCGLVDQCGLVFRHAAPPRTRGKVRLRHLTGNWYHLYDVF